MNSCPGPRSATGLRVRFVDDTDGTLSVLEIEIPRRQEILGDVHQALFEVGVQISNVELQVHADRVVERLRLVEADGSPIFRDRHLEVQTTVLAVVQERLVESEPPPAAVEAPVESPIGSRAAKRRGEDTKELIVVN